MFEKMKKQNQPQNFKVIFKELELKSNKELLYLTKDIKAVVSQVESQEKDLEKISALSVDNNQMYFSTGT